MYPYTSYTDRWPSSARRHTSRLACWARLLAHVVHRMEATATGDGASDARPVACSRHGPHEAPGRSRDVTEVQWPRGYRLHRLDWGFFIG